MQKQTTKNGSYLKLVKARSQLLMVTLLLACGGYRASAQLLPINGTNTFVKGANLPWLDGQYDHDIGINPLHSGWGCSYNSAHMNQYLADMHSMGITVVRLGSTKTSKACCSTATAMSPTWIPPF